MEARTLEHKYTYDDYAAWNDGIRRQLIDGVPYAMAGANRNHQSAVGNIFSVIRTHLRGKPCRVFVAPFDVRLNHNGADDTVVQPDVLVVCDETKISNGKHCLGAPDIAVEVLSPSSVAMDKIDKYEKYRVHGVREYWIADPDKKTFTIHTLQDGVYHAADYEVGASAVTAVLPGLIIDIAEVFE